MSRFIVRDQKDARVGVMERVATMRNPRQCQKHGKNGCAVPTVLTELFQHQGTTVPAVTPPCQVRKHLFTNTLCVSVVSNDFRAARNARSVSHSLAVNPGLPIDIALSQLPSIQRWST